MNKYKGYLAEKQIFYAEQNKKGPKERAESQKRKGEEETNGA